MQIPFIGPVFYPWQRPRSCGAGTALQSQEDQTGEGDCSWAPVRAPESHLSTARHYPVTHVLSHCMESFGLLSICLHKDMACENAKGGS